MVFPNNPELEAIMAETAEMFQQFTDEKTWDVVKTARLGDGNDPATVWVPPFKRHAPGSVYYYEEATDNKTVSQALGYMLRLPQDNPGRFGGYLINIGYPPKETMLHAWWAQESIDAFGGVLPDQFDTEVARIVTPDKVIQLKVEPNDTMNPTVTGGFWRVGLKIPRWTGGSSLDLTSYVPSTSGKSVWVLLCINPDKNFGVVAGDEFTTSAPGNTDDRLPDELPGADWLQLAFIKLDSGMTAIDDNTQILHCQLIPTVPGTGSDTGSEETIYLTDADGDRLTDADGDYLIGDPNA